jgi:lambda repressor-like predicted transcriptional regulator
MKLNSPKVRELLQEQERSVAWLARQIEISRFTLWQQISIKNPKHADKISKALGVKPTDLIVWEV